MKKTKNALVVKPVKRYKIAKYPSYSDPDPLSHPDSYPYPFRCSPPLLATSLGLVSTLQAAQQPFSPEEGNPFPVATSGLPHQTSPYGTGAPSRISDEVARKIIDAIFAEEGFSLTRDYMYNKDGVAFKASGYDENKKIGYVYATWENLDRTDAIIPWWRPNRKHFFMVPKNGASPLDIQTEDKSVAYRYLRNGNEEELARLAEYGEIMDISKRRKLLEGLIQSHFDRQDVEYQEQYGKTNLSLKEAGKLERQEADRDEYIAVISQFDRRFSYSSWSSINREDYIRVGKIKDKDERARAYQELQENAAHAALRQLEESVRRYINWARSQGLQ